MHIVKRSGLCVIAFGATLLWLWPLVADAQVFVYPRRSSQTNVRWHDFDWNHIEIMVGPKASGETIEDPGPRLHNRMGGTDHDHGADQTGLLRGPHKKASPSDWPAGRSLQSAPGGGLAQNPATSSQGGDQPEESEAEEVDEDDDVSPWSGGIKLYFYESEREIAEQAAAFIERHYRQLVDDFEYVPDKTFPYFLYSSYHEFLQTNLFPIQEGVLGVTSPESLEVTLPYFGDHAQFADVSKHELVHEFTIQKVEAYAEKNNAADNPLTKMPLWFIEGIAEYYAKDGLDAETETLVRDLVVNPDPDEEYVLEGFFDQKRRGYLWTYKLGQARAAFLEETYGDGTLQTIIEESYRLVGTNDGRQRMRRFPELLTEVTGDSRRTLSQKFENWLKRRHFRTYLDAEQPPGVFEQYEAAGGVVQAMSASPDGQVLMYRSISRETGRSRLHLVDYRDAKSPKKVASDGRPGVESLHPIAGRNFDINGDSIAYVARHRDRDVIYRQDYSQKVDKLSEEELEEREERRSEEPDAPDKEDRTATERAADRVSSVRFDLSERVRYRLDDWDIIAVDTVAFEPDGDRIAFVGLEQDGYKDLYVLDPGEDDEQFSVERITDDEYAEREVSWGEEGIVFTSDATDDGHYNVFWADPESKEIERLTYEERDHTSPRMLDDGRVYFVAYDEVGANIYHAVGPGLTRKTGVASALSDLSPGPRDGMWTLQYYQGRQRPARVPSDRLLDGDVSAQTTNGSVYELPERSLDEATDYNVWDLDSWEIGNFFGILGASTQGVAGQVYASANDELRDHVMVLNLLAAGSLETVDGSLVYFNQEDRLIWGGGVFQDVGFRYDRTFEDDDEVDEFISSERFFGASGTVRYPFDRFRFLQGSLAVGGINYFLYDGTEECLKTPDCLGRDVHDEWEEANDGVRFQIEPSVSLGYNTLRYHPQTGPFGGHSMLLSGTYDWQPFRERGYGTARLDAEKYWSLWGRTNFFLRSGLGYTFGGRFARSFFLSSYDTLRGVRWGNFDYLLGQSFLFSTAELQFPLNFIVDVPIIDLEGVLALDAGGVGGTGEEIDQVWDNRIFNYVLGTNFGLGPIVLRLHFAKTFDIGVKRPQDGDWATNLSVNWRYW